MKDKESIVKWVTEAVSLLVDLPESVRVTCVDGPMIHHLHVEVAPADFPRVIGRRGITADALRHLLKCMGQGQEDFTFDVLDPQRRAGQHPAPGLPPSPRPGTPPGLTVI